MVSAAHKISAHVTVRFALPLGMLPDGNASLVYGIASPFLDMIAISPPCLSKAN